MLPLSYHYWQQLDNGQFPQLLICCQLQGGESNKLVLNVIYKKKHNTDVECILK